MLIQILLVLAAVALLVVLARTTTSARHQALSRLGMVAFFLAAVVTILWPALLSRLASFLGVGRGTDLLLYALVVVVVAQVARSHRRANELQRKITLLTRELALTEARNERSAPPDL